MTAHFDSLANKRSDRKPRALLIGGTGFVGRHLAIQLADRYSIIATGHDKDIRNAQIMLELISRSLPEIVVNLAAITTVRESFQSPRETYDVNFLGLLNLFAALASCGFNGRVLHISSSEVYGFPRSEDLPITETTTLRPRSPYAVAKAASELLCYQWCQAGKFEVLVARPFTHIGPGQGTRFAVSRFAHQIAEITRCRLEPIIKVGNLSATRDLTDVRDVVRAYDKLLHEGGNGEIYNVCSNQEVVMRSVLDQLIKLSGIDVRVSEDIAMIREEEQLRLLGSSVALSAATGWLPEIPLSRTLTDMLACAIAPQPTTP